MMIQTVRQLWHDMRFKSLSAKKEGVGEFLLCFSRLRGKLNHGSFVPDLEDRFVYSIPGDKDLVTELLDMESPTEIIAAIGEQDGSLQSHGDEDGD